MKKFRAAFWAESLKMRRSRVPFFILLGFSIAPLIGGLFMIILKDPEAAKNMGLISTKAQLAAGTADWVTFFGFISQAVAVGGAILFSILTGWVFGREFSDRTAKELLALPVSRNIILAAKFTVTAIWTFAMSVWIFMVGLGVGSLVNIPGFSMELFRSAVVDVLGAAALTITLIPFVAFIASIGRGYLPAFGWAVFTVFISQVSIILGFGDWLPWAIPALFTGAAGPRAEMLGTHSYFVLFAANLFGLFITFRWWLYADQAK